MRFGFCGLILLAGVAHAGAPPLAPNEEIVKTRDGCGMVIRSDKLGAEYVRKNIGEVAWGGACIEGLAMGEGVVHARKSLSDGIYMEEARGWAWYGRRFGATVVRYSDGGQLHAYAWDGEGAMYKSVDRPTWSKSPGLGSAVSADEVYVSTGSSPFGVFVSHGKQYETFPCPNKESAEGCESVWLEHAGPVIAQARAFITKYEPKAKARQKQLQPIIAQWQKRVGPELVARGAAVAQGLNEGATSRSEWEQACRNRNRLQRDEISASRQPGTAVQIQTERLALATKQLYEGDCAGHPDAERELKRVAEDLAWVARELARDEEDRRQKAEYERQAAEFERQQQAQRAQQRREDLGAIVDALTVFQTTKNAVEQLQAAQAQADAQGRAQGQQAALSSPGSESQTGRSGSTNQNRTSGNPSGKVQIPAVMNCAQHLPFTRDSFGYQYVHVRNTCGFPIKAYVKVTKDGNWTTYDDYAREIAPGATTKGDGIKSDNLQAQLMTACPTEEEMERRLGKNLTNVYFQNENAWGCWIQYEPSAVGTSN